MLLAGHRYRGGLFALVFALTTMTAAAIGQTDAASKKEGLQREFNAACEEKDFPRAADIGLKLTALEPKDFVSQYRLAAVYALSGDRTNALKWFKNCADNGYSDIRTAKTDPDFESIRSDEAFQDALEVIRKNRRVAYEEFKVKAAEKEPLVILSPDHDNTTEAPLLIVMHDDGGTAEEFAEIFRDTAQRMGAILIAPRAVYPAEGGGYRWGKRYEGDFVLMRALELTTNRYNTHQRQRVVVGLGEGGTIAMVSAYRHAQEFRGVIAVAPQYDPLFAPPPNPMRSRVPRYYLMVGDKDEALEDCRKYAAEYKAMPLEVKLKVYEGLGHELPKNFTAELQRALTYVRARVRTR